MAFFSPTFSSAITQPKMRQEGFHLPSPSPSNGQPPSPSSSAFNDMFLPHASQTSSHHGGAHASAGAVAGGGGGFPSLGLPDAYSRSSGATMDLSDELASLMASPQANTSSERSTHAHTPPYDHHGQAQHHPHNGNGAHHNDGSNGYHPTHNIFDISAPPSHFTSSGAHAFSLPHTSTHRQDLNGISQPSSLHSPFDAHHPNHSHLHAGAHQNLFSPGGGLTRDGFPAHFNSTIPPLSNHHDVDPPQSISSVSASSIASEVLLSPSQTHHTNPFGHGPPYTPTTSNGSAPTRETPSPGDASHGLTNGAGVSAPKKTNGHARRATTSTARSDSRSRSRVRPGTSSSTAGAVPGTPASLTGTGAGGPTRTTKSTSKQRRDSFTYHPGAMGGMLAHHGQHQHHGHPRPQAIVIPSHSTSGGGPGSARNGPASPLGMGMPVNGMPPMGSMGGMAGPMGMGVGQASGWFLPTSTTPHGSMPPGMGGEFSLPTPDSVGGSGFGQFGTSVGSMGISPKDTTLGAKGEETTMDAVSKQAAIVNEKRRRRRESHNAVERRRRDNINEKITELATLIPEVMLDPSAPASSTTDEVLSPTCESRKEGSAGPQGEGGEDGKEGSAGTPGPGGAAVKANKGMILRKSVEYIRYLQQLVNVQAARNRDLEAQLTNAGISPAAGSTPPMLNGAIEVTDSDQQDQDMNGSAFGDDVLSFMSMGVNGTTFSHLEPMAEHEMEMEGMDDGLESITREEPEKHSAANGCPPVRRRPTNDASGSVSGSGEVTSPSVGSEEGEGYDEDGVLEARGRRDRDGRPRLTVGDVTVKEEGEGMEM